MLFSLHRDQFHYLLQAARALSLHEGFESPRAPRRPTTPSPILVFRFLFKREFQTCSVKVNGALEPVHKGWTEWKAQFLSENGAHSGQIPQPCLVARRGFWTRARHLQPENELSTTGTLYGLALRASPSRAWKPHLLATLSA